MRDPYTVLGVSRTASQDEIKSAYRKAARTMHPDVNKSDPKAEDKFKELSQAYHLLSDAKLRARFDRGEIDAQGNERGFSGARRGGRAGGAGGYTRSGRATGGAYGFDFNNMFDDNDIFSDMFRRAGQGAGGPNMGQDAPRKGTDAQYRLKVSFEDAALGTTRRITLTNRKTLDVRIPPGTEDGKTLRLKGQGNEGTNGGPHGDALVEIGVLPHPLFHRDGTTVTADIPVTLTEAVMGGKITVPTLEGKVVLNVPEGSNTGSVLRLRGKGIPGADGTRGDLMITLKIVLPDPNDPKLKSAVKKLKDTDGTALRDKAATAD